MNGLARCWSVVAIAGAAPLLAQADAARLPVEDFRVLMVQALDAPSGSVAGVLTGEMAEAVSAHLGASSPIFIDVTTLRRYRQSGCARLNLRFSQTGVRLPDSTQAQDRAVNVGINYCRDGKPPRSLP